MFAKQGVPPDSGSTPTSSPLSGGPPSSPCPPTPLRKTIPALNMRMKTFKKSSAKIHDSLSRCRSGKPLHRYSGCQRGSNLELLRKALQPSINREMQKMFDDYHELFSMANENIRENIAKDDDSRPEQFLLVAMRIAIEEAKRSFATQFPPYNAANALPLPRPVKKRPVVAAMDASRLLAVIDGSEFGPDNTQGHDNNHSSSWSQNPQSQQSSLSSTSVQCSSGNNKRPPMQWSLSRINSDTLFTLGSRANKALGLGTTRGRLYIKHPEIFKYPADQADKQWLSENGHMQGVGGRVYLVFTEDLFDLAESREYKNMPGVNPALISGFKLPTHIQNKARQYMSTMVQYIKKAASNVAVTQQNMTGGEPSVSSAHVQVGSVNGGPLREVNAMSSASGHISNKT